MSSSSVRLKLIAIVYLVVVYKATKLCTTIGNLYTFKTDVDGINTMHTYMTNVNLWLLYSEIKLVQF